jgi:hypothetical protein
MVVAALIWDKLRSDRDRNLLPFEDSFPRSSGGHLRLFALEVRQVANRQSAPRIHPALGDCDSQETGMTLTKLALAAGVAALGTTAASAQWLPRGWHVIGYKVVNGRVDRDTIYVPGRQAFRQIRLCAFNAPLHLRNFRVEFRNGARQDIRTREYLRPGTCTRNVDLRGRYRDIARVHLNYERVALRARPPLVRVAAR